MYVTLLRDIPNLGKKDERVLVSDAYARNVLLPKKQVVVGKQSEKRIADTPSGSDFDVSKISGIEKEKIEIKGKANEKSGLYKKIGEEEITSLIAKKVSVPQNLVSLKDFASIKTTGEHTVQVVFAGTHTKKITLLILAE